jgi:hypothetical protein
MKSAVVIKYLHMLVIITMIKIIAIGRQHDRVVSRMHSEMASGYKSSAV